MNIYRPQLFPQTTPESFVQPQTPSSASVTEKSHNDQNKEHNNSLQLPARGIASNTVHPLSNGAAGARTVLPALTTDTSKLNKVSDPRHEIKKEATSPNGLLAVSYSLATPSSGLSNITFPMSIDEGLQRKSGTDAGIYYAMMFGVNTEKNTYLGRGYIGMQPRGDAKALIIFSGYGPHFKASQGTAEFDGVKGASNSTLVDFKFGNKYNLTVERDPANAKNLKAYIQDVTDPDNPEPRQHVKDLSVDQRVVLVGTDTGFVEQYGAKINQSSQIAPTRGSFFAPFTTDDEGNIKVGEIKSNGLYGRYKNSVVGQQQIVKAGGVGKELEFSLQGVVKEEAPAAAK
ncbi:hypothetical protein ACI77J_18710 [Pseudomonas sp. O64]|uniref:hypothetical protein n=1 Tax=Pseudomonas TaxID=286 RepID=UPI001F5A180F|nr:MULTISPECIES: hypothetical protein [unclassified Pseudomonas]MCV2228383.1 hypothetical protein [Pseudomonas sp. AU10]